MPTVIAGEGDFVLSAVKEIRVTEQFASLGQHIKKCQMTEFKEDCLSRETPRKCLNYLKIFISGTDKNLKFLNFHSSFTDLTTTSF